MSIPRPDFLASLRAEVIWAARLDPDPPAMRFWGFGGIPSAGREVITYHERDMFDELGLGAVVLEARDAGRDPKYPSSAGGARVVSFREGWRDSNGRNGCSVFRRDGRERLTGWRE